MNEPNIAGTSPIAVELEEGKNYFFCTCGLSANQPYCDGSHKGTDFKPHKFTAEETGKKWLCLCKRTGNKPYCDGSHKALREKS
ncbi:MAG: CDGSH iron-sulfur domain-containing protein [Alphaproteobacteria bacterium]|nr:CDGSH iron-sulfur domain-containing protein [Alphaproteobacteria bacterium]